MKKDYAGFWVRFFAGLLDVMFLMPVIVVLIYFFGISDYQMLRVDDNFGSHSYFGASGSGEFLDWVSYAVSVTYIAYFVSSKRQATLGKRVLGIYVGNLDGSKLSWQKSLARALASILTSMTLGLGFFMLVFTKEKTALHDLICGTRVFHGKKNVE